MKLLKDYCYNPFFVDVNNKRYEITNIVFFNHSGVICETGRGWFASEHGGSNNDLKNGLELPTEYTLKRKADFSADAAFIIKYDNEGYMYSIRGYQVSKKDCYTLEIRNANKILKAVNGLLNTITAGDFVGLWVENGFIYIDISERIERLSAAMVAGIARKQKSIFDWCMGRCIGLEG